MCSNHSATEQGKLIIISAPSGAGKTTLVHYLLQTIPNLQFSVSCTTRNPREGEINGKDYYFLSTDEFQNKINNQEFAEFEQVYEDLYYGTLQSEIERITQEGKHIIFDIDVQGGINLKKQYPDALAIFISPPNQDILKERLEARNTENQSSLEMRIAKSEQEMEFQNQFDRVLVNDDLSAAQKEIVEVVQTFLKDSK